MSVTYRTKRRLQTFGIFVMVAILVMVFVWMIWLLWLDRYVVYSDDGVKLDFSLSVDGLWGEVATPPPSGETIPIHINEGEEEVTPVTTELTQIYGYYINAAMLRKEMSTVISQVEKLPANTPVLLDVKDISGRFYFSTALGVETDPKMDIQAVDGLIQLLQDKNLYAIARIPAFRDRLHGLHNVPHGLYHTSGKYLWMDETRCYWLNPTSEGALNYILEVVAELKALGFDEVVFDDFRFPNTDQIKFYDDRDEAIKNAASFLAASLATKNFAVSFVSNTYFPLPEGRTRLYITSINAADVVELEAQMSLDLADARMVFLTDSRDTRFESYSILRPITTEVIDTTQS